MDSKRLLALAVLLGVTAGFSFAVMAAPKAGSRVTVVEFMPQNSTNRLAFEHPPHQFLVFPIRNRDFPDRINVRIVAQELRAL